MTTKVCALTDGRSLPFELLLTPCQAGDCPAVTRLPAHLCEDTILLGDKAYDAGWVRRRVAARNERNAANDVAVLKLASTRLWLRNYEFMT